MPVYMFKVAKIPYTWCPCGPYMEMKLQKQPVEVLKKEDGKCLYKTELGLGLVHKEMDQHVGKDMSALKFEDFEILNCTK